jgi:Eco57I restriction-modification methylase/TaqI-like C-terminal specificity domain
MNADFPMYQTGLPGLCPIIEATEALAHAGDTEARGAVYTRLEVVNFILDLVGYHADRPLWQLTLLEPSFGAGDFLQPAIDRLLQARQSALDAGLPDPTLDDCIRAVELHHASHAATAQRVVHQLRMAGIETAEAERLASIWLIQGDFLLTSLPQRFDCVVGNPPYVRQELVPEALLREYRRRYATLYDRADLYIPFIERSLRLLSKDGQLGFICADRWTKNRYGGPLRALISSQFHLRAYIDMVDTPAFHSEVAAYPAITLIANAPPGPTWVAAKPKIAASVLKSLSDQLCNGAKATSSDVHQIECLAQGDEPWMLSATSATALIRRIEASHPLLEDTGCKVGIGVATGADRAFIANFDSLDVEADCKLPLATTRDLTNGHVQWQGLGVINPFTDSGALVDLNEHPRLARHLDVHREQIAGRHVAKRDAGRWYRTIDRITPALAKRPKLLIPDIKGHAQVAYEPGQLYPHHNLYYVVSDSWDLHALQAVLLSTLTRLFIASYSTKMRGGFLRFQAQYLRRLRLPHWADVPEALRTRLAEAAKNLDLPACNEAVADLYQLSELERATLKAT